MVSHTRVFFKNGLSGNGKVQLIYLTALRTIGAQETGPRRYGGLFARFSTKPGML